MTIRHSGPPSNVSTIGVKVTWLNGDVTYYWALSEKARKDDLQKFTKRTKGKKADVKSVEKASRAKTI